LELRGAESGEVIISNIFGQEVYRTRAGSGSTEIDLSGQAAGLYFVKVLAGEDVFIKKLVLK